MKQFKLAASLFFGTVFFSSAVCAHVSFKDEILSANTNVPYNWSGLYAGINAGIVKHTLDVTDNNAASFNATIQQAANPQASEGFQVGYRHQINPTSLSGVYGAELSANFSNAMFNQGYGSSFALYQFSAHNTLKSNVLLQLMGGIAANRTLLFMTGGLAWTNIYGNMTSANGAPFFNTFNVGKQALGSTIGGGVEYAFTDRISARFKVDVITPNVYSTSDTTGNLYQITNHVVQATIGINVKLC